MIPEQAVELENIDISKGPKWSRSGVECMFYLLLEELLQQEDHKPISATKQMMIKN